MFSLIRKKSRPSGRLSHFPDGPATVPIDVESAHLKSSNTPVFVGAMPATKLSPRSSDPGHPSPQRSSTPYHPFQTLSRSSMFPTHPNASHQSHSNAPSAAQISLSRKNRQSPQFNILVVGGQSTGKTRFLETLEATLIPRLPSQTPLTQLKTIKATQTITSNSHHVSTLLGERVVLNLIDTAGLDIRSGDDFRVDLQMNEILRFIEDKFEESLQIERQVHRNPSRLGESHVHVSVYFIDPATIVNRAFSSSRPDVNHSIPEADAVGEHLSSIDLRQLKRLSRRSNILPVISRADELTEARLAQLKRIVYQDLKAYGIPLGVFDDSAEGEDQDSEETSTSPDESEPTQDHGAPSPMESGNSNESVQQAPKKLVRRKSATMSIAARRSRTFMMNHLRDELISVIGVIPLSLIGPEFLPAHGMDAAQIDRLNQTNPLAFCLAPEKERAAQPQVAREAQEDALAGSTHGAAYVRQFRWATVDVLNPKHCDFLLARAILLGTHLSKLKESTRIEKYENYRTEKLLSRRATMGQGPKVLEEQRRIAMEVEKIEIPHLQTPKSIFGIQFEGRHPTGEPHEPHPSAAPSRIATAQQSWRGQGTESNQRWHRAEVREPAPASAGEMSPRKNKAQHTHSFIGSRLMRKPAPNANLASPPSQLYHLPNVSGLTEQVPMSSFSYGDAGIVEPYPSARSQSRHSNHPDTSTMNQPMVF